MNGIFAKIKGQGRDPLSDISYLLYPGLSYELTVFLCGHCV